MTVSNVMKKGVIAVMIMGILITLFLGVAKQKEFFLQTLVIIMAIVMWIAMQSGSINVQKLKGTNFMFIQDGIQGNLIKKPEYYGDGEMLCYVSLPSAYVPSKYQNVDLSWGEVFWSMLSNTTVVKVKNKVSRFQNMSESLAPEGTIQYYGSLSGVIPNTRLEILEKETENLNHTILTLRTSLFKIKTELEKESHLDIGSLDGARKFIQNIKEELGDKIHILGAKNSDLGSDKK